jgi:hypothetical protein
VIDRNFFQPAIKFYGMDARDTKDGIDAIILQNFNQDFAASCHVGTSI